MTGEGDPSGPLLRLEGLSVGYRDRTVLDGIDLTIGHRGVLALMGPAGVGKSTLLRTLSRWTDLLPSTWRRGRVTLEGVDLFEDLSRDQVHRLLPLLNQTGRLYTGSVLENAISGVGPRDHPLSREEKLERAHRVLDPWGLWEEYAPRLDEPVIHLPMGQQRRLALVRLHAGGARCVLADEPFRGLAPEDEESLSTLLTALGEQVTVFLSSHLQRVVRRLADRVALLAAGKIVEEASVEDFFEAPTSPLTRDYLLYGNCWPKAEPPGSGDWSLAASPEPAAPDPAASSPPADAPPLRPDEFHWVIPDLLGGCQQPGLLHDADRQLRGLVELGCRVLVNLREEEPPRTEALQRHGIESVHVPIVDMEVPSLEIAQELCERISSWVDEGRTTVLHCKAGLGRTGTLLACALVWRGMDPVQAVEEVRSVNPRYIQSDCQLAFISEFGHYREDLAETHRS